MCPQSCIQAYMNTGKQAGCTLCFPANAMPCNAAYNRNVWQELYTVRTAYLSSGYQTVSTLCLQHLLQNVFMFVDKITKII
jgi:hypothetical protein